MRQPHKFFPMRRDADAKLFYKEIIDKKLRRFDIMLKEKIDLRDELREYKFEFDLLQKIPCSKQENKEYKK